MSQRTARLLAMALEGEGDERDMNPDNLPAVDIRDDPLIATVQTMEEINDQSDYITRLQDVADGLESIALSLESHRDDGLSSQAHHFFRHALEAHAANDPFGPLEIPSFETLGGTQTRLATTISLEAVTDRIRQIVRMIKELLVKVWEKISDFFIYVVKGVATERLRVELLYNRCNELEGHLPHEQEVNIGRAAYGVATDIGIPRDGHMLDRSLHDFVAQLRTIRTHYVPTVLNIGRGFEQGIRSWTGQPSSGEAWLDKMNAVAREYDIRKLSSHIGRVYKVVDPRFELDTTIAASALPGNRSIVFVDGKKVYPEKFEGNTVEKAVALQASRVEMVRMIAWQQPDLAHAKMKIMTIQEIRDCLGFVSDILNEVENGTRAHLGRDLKLAARNLQKSADSISNNAPEDAQYLARGLAYCTTFTNWAQKPYIQLLGHALVVVRGTLAVAGKQLNAYT